MPPCTPPRKGLIELIEGLGVTLKSKEILCTFLEKYQRVKACFKRQVKFYVLS